MPCIPSACDITSLYPEGMAAIATSKLVAKSFILALATLQRTAALSTVQTSRAAFDNLVNVKKSTVCFMSPSLSIEKRYDTSS